HLRARPGDLRRELDHPRVALFAEHAAVPAHAHRPRRRRGSQHPAGRRRRPVRAGHRMNESLAVEMRGITKAFPGVVANNKVDLEVRQGEILALVGENGAGKSTLMNLLYGLLHPDEGEILIDGKPAHIGGPRDAIALGIGMVHQHFMLIPVFTVGENVMLGREPVIAGGLYDHARARAEIATLTRQYGLALDADARMGDLPVGLQQRAEIVKVLYRGANILVLDEPTGVLTPQESKELFGVLRDLVKSGKTIIFISHKLREVLEISDRITVMR